jgi:hypothetical protein
VQHNVRVMPLVACTYCFVKCICFHICACFSIIIDMPFLQTTHIFSYVPKSSLRIFKEISHFKIFFSSFLKIKNPICPCYLVPHRVLLMQIMNQCLAMPCCWHLVAGLSPLGPGFIPGPVHVGFILDKVALGHVYSEDCGFPLSVSFHQCSLFIHSSTMDAA